MVQADAASAVFYSIGYEVDGVKFAGSNTHFADGACFVRSVGQGHVNFPMTLHFFFCWMGLTEYGNVISKTDFGDVEL
jgi:hypothetical protein